MSALDKYKSAIPTQAASEVKSAGSALDKYKSAKPTPAPAEAKAPEKEGITRAELEEIAAKHQMSADTLERLAPTFGSRVTTDKPLEDESTTTGKRVLGELYENTLLGLPQYIIRKSMKPNERAAIEDMAERIKSRQHLLSLDTLVDVAASAPTFAIGGLAAGAKTIPQLAKEGVKAVAPAINRLGLAAGTTAAVKGGLEAREGEALKEAAKSGALGYLVGATLGTGGAVISRAASKTKEKVQQRAFEHLNEWAEKEGVRLEEKIAKARIPLKAEQDSLGQQVISKLDTEDPKLTADQLSFANYISRSEGKSATGKPEEAQKMLQTLKATEGEEFLKKRWENYQDVETASKVMREDVDVLNAPTGKFFDRLAMRLIDNRPLFTILDKRTGSDGLLKLDNLSQSQKGYNNLMYSFIPKHKELKALSEGVDVRKVRMAMRAQDISTLSEPEQKFAVALNSVYKQRLAQAQEKGLPITAAKGPEGNPLEFYQPEQMVEPIDAIMAIRNKVREVNNTLGKDIRNLSTEEFKVAIEQVKEQFPELLKGMKMLTRLETVEESPYAFNAALKSISNAPKLSELMDISAGAAFERKGTIPDFLLEQDPLKLLKTWERDTFRTAYFREGLEDLRALRQKYLTIGEDNGADVVQVLINDLTGRTRGLSKATRDLLFSTSLAARERLETGEGFKPLNQLMANSPEYFYHLTNQIYPNYLGWNPRAAVQNMLQPVLVSVPELGPKYGSQTFLKAYLQTAKDMLKDPNLAAVLRKEGVAGANWNQEMTDALQEGMLASTDSAVLKALMKLNKGFNTLGMLPFEGAETLNRYATHKAAQIVAKDFLAGKDSAIKYFLTMPSSYRNAITKAKKAGDSKEVDKLFSQYLIAKTMFNYDRITMSEAGRFLGPGLSSFLKWPTVIAGDVLATIKTNPPKEAAKDLTKRYLAPLAIIKILQSAALTEEDEEHPLYKAAFGKGGLAGSAPANTLSGIFEGKQSAPPIIKTGAKGIAAGVHVAGGDFEPAWKWLNEAMYSYAPQGGLIRFLVSDLPAITGEEKPKGTISNKVQKALTGEGTLDSFFKKDR